MTETFPAITIWQPWATLIAEGLKPFEFRSWAAPARLVGKRIAIHAGARHVVRAEIDGLIYKLQHPTARAQTGLVDHRRAIQFLERVRQVPATLPTSSVICTAILGKPIRNAELATALGIEHINDSSRENHSNWGWPLSDVERLIPFVPAHGAQGFWTWTKSDA